MVAMAPAFNVAEPYETVAVSATTLLPLLIFLGNVFGCPPVMFLCHAEGPTHK